MPSPNDLTPTRIPNAIIVVGSSDPYDTQSLRKVYNNNVSNIVIGPKKGHQYYFNPVNGNYRWRAGLTPGDNGYLNDGTSPGSTSADSPSRYAVSSFEWWDDYVIYCMGGHTPGPNGNDLLEIFVASGTGTQSLCSIVGKLTGVMLNSTISEALTTISGQNDLLCVNTHYPNIPIYNNVNYYKLKLLIDFGFIPCFPRGGNKAYDISGQLDNTMSFGSNVDWMPKNSNSAGGCIRFNDSYLGVILQPAVASDSVLNNFSVNDGFTINIWVKVDALPSGLRSEVIIDNRDINSNAGYALGITSAGFFRFYVGNGTSYDNVITTDAIVPKEWYNVVCRFKSISGTSTLEIIISQPVLGFNYSSNSTVGSGYSPNTTRPFIIGRSQTNANGFNGYISLVSIYDGWLLTPTVEELYKAYDDLTVDLNSVGRGRYWNYY
jgi:hypothetical protein